jgi:arylsulfatase A-like enzyme
MPLIVRYPAEVVPVSVCDEIVLNVDFAPTILDLAGLEPHERMQGRSLRALLRHESPSDWRPAAYYRYWEHLDSSHRVAAHCGIWTRDFKLVHYYGDGCGQPGASSERRAPEWELFDLARDPAEMQSVFDDPAYADVADDLQGELVRQMRDLGDELPGSLADQAAAGSRAGAHG